MLRKVKSGFNNKKSKTFNVGTFVYYGKNNRPNML